MRQHVRFVPKADIELAFTRLSPPCGHRPPRAHQLEGVIDFLSVRAHVNHAGGLVREFVVILRRNRIAEEGIIP